MFTLPGTTPDFAKRITHEAAERVAGNWYLILLNGLVLIVAGVLIFSIDWTVSSLSTFIGALFIAQGVVEALTTGFDLRVRRANVLAGLLSIAAGIAIVAWPKPGLLAVAIFLGAWLLEVPLGILALANPGATLAALITVAGIWAAAVGVMRVTLSFEVKRLPQTLQESFTRSEEPVASAQGPLRAAS
jgi:uncharacterized membrane protein HdeD (DUF308 family)